MAQALIEMVRELRQGNGRYGLVLANGGSLTYQHVVCLSSQPRKDKSPYPTKNHLPDALTDITVPPIAAQVEGEAVIEVYSLHNCKNRILWHTLIMVKSDIYCRLRPQGQSFERLYCGPPEG